MSKQLILWLSLAWLPLLMVFAHRNVSSCTGPAAAEPCTDGEHFDCASEQ
ncbi:MAG: hypothetical protein ACOX00_03875 [Peptoniphilaceae bacterium]